MKKTEATEMNQAKTLAKPSIIPQIPWENGKLRVSDNGRFLCHENGTPFFWLADTGWLMFTRLTREEIEVYLEDRKQKGFNVIQVMVLHTFPQVNVYGKTALDSFDNIDWNSKPKKTYDPDNYDYWDHVDYAVDKAAEKGIYLALVPVWGSIVKNGHLTRENAYEYGKWLALRYKDKPNIIWVNGGDIRGDFHTEIWNTLGNAIKEYDPNHLMTFHPFGRTQSSMWFHNEKWLDFNMFQSGHRRYDQIIIEGEDEEERLRSKNSWKGEDNWKYVMEDLQKEPLKPTIDGEPSYEGIPQGLHDPNEPFWTDDDCRRYAYWSVFAGAFGHTYGHSAVMQMHKPEYGKGNYGVKKYWYEAINDPGASQMQHLKNLILSVPYFERVPDQSVLCRNDGEKYDYILATRGKDYLFAYTYTARDICVKMGKTSGATVDAWWYNPRNGALEFIESFENTGEREFCPPGPKQAGNDWVLAILDSSKEYFK